ncbi:MAG: glycosyltransferase family 4 protein [Candidatus Thorarchaeota archaeon]
MLEVAYVSSYSPRECGIASFTEDLTKSIDKLKVWRPSAIIGVNDPGSSYDYGKEVIRQIDEDDITTYQEAADFANNSDLDLVNVQHEFGLFGGLWGNYLLTFLKKLKKPIVTTMHTTLSPNAKILDSPESADAHNKVVKGIGRASSAIVVMTNMAAHILQESYGIDMDEIKVIPHGSPSFPFVPSEPVKNALGLEGRTVLSTFGFLSQDKGIHHAIKALPEIVKDRPDILYLIIGITHPQVRMREGEKYRKRLVELVHKLELRDNVRFHNRFLSEDELIQYLQATDVYICPYVNKEQLSSGTVTYALGAGKPIISTPFFYAEELLAEGRGILCQFRSPRSITNGIKQLLDNPEKKARIEKLAYEHGRNMTWPRVASRYVDLFKEFAQ